MAAKDSLSRAELVELVKKVIDTAYGDGSDDLWELLETLGAAVPHPRPFDVIQGQEGDATTPDEIVDCLLEYKPLITPPPGN